jgi:hypothetical protein
MQWHTSFVDLPQWCNRTLAPDAVLRASVGATQVGGVGFTSPDKGKNGGRPISPASHPTLDKLLLVFTKKLEREEEVMQGEAQEKVKVEKMAAIQRQLEIIHSARQLVADEPSGVIFQKYTRTINKLNMQLLQECAIECDDE